MRNPIDPDSDNLGGLPKVGDVFDDKYRIDGILGIGGMGIVFAATHLHLDEKVALKLLLPRWAEEAEIVERFMREGRASIKIRSEHVVRVLDVGIVLSQPYLVLEYLEGKDLDALLKDAGPLPVSGSIDCILQACEALAEAHMAGIIHRDLKPANLFLTHRADGSPSIKVLDFGISKILSTSQRLSGFHAHETMPNTVMGSPPYMSPEQLESSRDADERSDIWSIGAITYELITGRPPFEADTITALCARVLRDPPPPVSVVRADVDPALEAAVLRCLEKQPENRFATVAELARAFAPFGSASSVASAERISRIIDGGIEPHGARPSPADYVAPRQNVGSGRLDRPRAAAILESVPPTPMRSALPAYVLVCAGFLALGGGIGWAVVHQTEALHAAEQQRPVAELPPPLPSASTSIPAPPVGASASAAVPVQALTTTSALASAATSAVDAGMSREATQPPAPAASALAPAPRIERPEPVVQPAVSVASMAAAPARPRHARRVVAPAPEPVSLRAAAIAPSPRPDDDNPYRLDSVPAPTSTAPVAPADPSQLFEGRK